MFRLANPTQGCDTFICYRKQLGMRLGETIVEWMGDLVHNADRDFGRVYYSHAIPDANFINDVKPMIKTAKNIVIGVTEAFTKDFERIDDPDRMNRCITAYEIQTIMERFSDSYDNPTLQRPKIIVLHFAKFCDTEVKHFQWLAERVVPQDHPDREKKIEYLVNIFITAAINEVNASDLSNNLYTKYSVYTLSPFKDDAELYINEAAFRLDREREEFCLLKTSMACMFIVLASIFCLGAKADSIYVFPDSSQRLLSESEISEWNYDSLGIAYHEILARHGYHFNESGEYYAYFAKQEWYQESEESNDEIYRRLSETERENISRIKECREQMLEKNVSSMRGKDIKSVIDRLKEESPYSGFQRVYLGASKTMELYSGPGESYTRVAKGKAILSTNGDVYCAGYDGDWLMVLYENNDGIVRIGYVQYPVMVTVLEVPRLSFSRENAVVISDCEMTDTPFPGRERIRNLRFCNGVTYLGSYEATEKWAYIEVATRNTIVRGYIPYEAIHVYSSDLPCHSYGEKSVGISRYSGSAETLIIPDRIYGKEVIAIEEHAFSGTGFGRSARFSKVVIPDGVVRIEEWAFANCENLVEVVLPKSLWFIRDSAFAKCRNLTKVDLPSSVKEIGNNAFAFCPNLGDLIIRSHRVEIEDLAFNSSNVRLVLPKGSTAEAYAREKGIEYIYLSDYELK